MSDLFNEFDVVQAFWMTIKLTAVSAVLSLIIGTVVAVMRLSPVPAFRAFGTAYVTIFRNTPLTVILFFCSFGIWQTLKITLASNSDPHFFDTNNFRLALLGLSIYHA